ncbi:biliverdin-producing heme oxygenase [Gulosibacter bifidus]|uniref:Heme oxygenase (Biliverdin-producing) n=1 Tax=Gulosibacter bifidus TaxID=272239 RepID=A0ABW5RIU6_9MICO|nr:biliverdin-producing heme oxygenase [Gulosibacter bifidus]
MTITETATATPLATRLREETSAAHENAERADFLEALLGGNLSLNAWFGLLEQYQYIYGALEAAVAAAPENPAMVELFDLRLDRSSTIAADLHALEMAHHVTSIGPQPSTLAYVERIRSCRFDEYRILAHHYTRYLGDLSGGQVMRTLLTRHYGLTSEESTFFAFDIGALPPYKKRYRECMNALPLTRAEADRVVDEANISFTYNQQIFAELAEIYTPATAA